MASLFAAPAVVKAANIMPVKVMPPELVVEKYAYHEVGIGYRITRKEVGERLWNEQNDLMHRALAESFQQTKEIYAANMLDGSSGLLIKKMKVLRSSGLG
jgi:hypothetical protein